MKFKLAISSRIVYQSTIDNTSVVRFTGREIIIQIKEWLLFVAINTHFMFMAFGCQFK